MPQKPMSIWLKLLLTPFFAFFLMIITVGIMGSFLDYSWFKNNMPNGLPVYLAWQSILVVALLGNYIWKRFR